MYNNSIITTLMNIQRMLAPPDYKIYVSWILSKKRYEKMKKRK